jgi:hypothetical protein
MLIKRAVGFFGVASHILSDIRRHIRNHHYEFTDGGELLVSKLTARNELLTWAPDGLGWTRDTNMVVTEGKNHILDVVLHGTTQKSTWYVAPIGANVTVLTTWTGATFYSAASEATFNYSESTRPAYVEIAASSGSTDNTASPAVFTAGADTQVLYGAGLLSTSTKADTSGSQVLLAASKYSTARTLAATSDTIGVKWVVGF